SLVEFSVFITFIIDPLMLLMHYFTKIIENKHYSDMSSRYIAWERTAWLEQEPGNWSGDDSILAIKDSNTVHGEVKRRILQGHNSIISSEEPSEEWSSDDAAVFLKFNQSSQFEKEFLLAAFNPTEENEEQLNYFQPNTDNRSVPGSVSSLLTAALSVLEVGNFDVETKGYYKATYKTQLTSHKLLEFINEDNEADPANENADEENKRSHQFEIPLESTTYIVANGWNVGGESHNEKRVKSLVPSNLLDNGFIDFIRNGISAIPIAKKLSPDSLKFGHVELGELPDSRKGESSTQGNEK
ncbi:MAG: hypothetical protein ACTILD_04115, partial [Pseudoalteromonas sp.]